MSQASLHLMSGGYLSCPNISSYNFGTSDFTLEAWVKTLSGGTVIGKKGTDGGPGNGGYLLVIRPDGTIKLATDNGFGFAELDTVPCSVNDGVWHHIAAVRQGASITIYLDGVMLAGTPRGNAAPPLNVDNPYALFIGNVAQTYEPYRNFDGNLAEVRIWNCARTAQDISDNLSYRLAPGTANLVGYWSAEFSLTTDFSDNRNAVQTVGMVMPSTDAPAVSVGNGPNMTFIFTGAYDSAVKWGGNSGTWNSVGTFYLTSMGFAVLNNQVLKGAVVAGNRVSWPLDGNPNLGAITFMLSSSNPYYWPSGNQPKYCFQGSCQAAGSGAVDFRGVILPVRLGCANFLNIGTGQVLNTINPVIGSTVTLSPKTAAINDHYCIYDDNHILNMASGLALSVATGAAAGAVITLQPIGAAGQLQEWTLGNDGLIRQTSNTSLALVADTTMSPARLILAATDATAAAQKFTTLENAQFLWNKTDNVVLTASGNTVSTALKADDAPAELWYTVGKSLINAVNAQALAVQGQPVAGSVLGLAPLNPGDASQVFESNGAQYIHTASGLPVKMTTQGGAVVLGTAGETDAATQWILAPTDPDGGAHTAQALNSLAAIPRVARSLAVADAAPAPAPAPAAVATTVSYTIWITTGDFIAAGTDDKVEISIDGDQYSTTYIELKSSETHSDPFERGQTDRFTVTTQNVGKIKGMRIRYGANNWFFNDRWVLSAVQIFDPTTLRTYFNNSVGNGAQFEVPSNSYIELPNYIVGGSDSTMSCSKAPTQDQFTRGWVDHTWITVTGDGKTTYFDCAGGHGGPGTVNDIITGTCSLNTAVKMATSYPISPAHPYKDTYGHNDVNGVETCGVRASGKINWDGQCHQMANRLLYICNPTVSLDDIPWSKQPTGYGLTCMMFGKYGVNFDKWCRDNGFAVLNQNNYSLYNFIQRIAGNSQDTIKIAYWANHLDDETSSDAQNPQGPAIHEFFNNVKNDGISNSTMSQLTNLTEAQVVQEQQGGNAPRSLADSDMALDNA